jgi:hypothetical protein
VGIKFAPPQINGRTKKDVVEENISAKKEKKQDDKGNRTVR